MNFGDKAVHMSCRSGLNFDAKDCDATVEVNTTSLLIRDIDCEIAEWSSRSS